MAKEPREGSVTLAGIPWLARMIDKARLEAKGEIEPYDLDYPCPMDQRLLSQFQMSGETFQKIVMESKDDQEILEQLQKHNAILT